MHFRVTIKLFFIKNIIVSANTTYTIKTESGRTRQIEVQPLFLFLCSVSISFVLIKYRPFLIALTGRVIAEPVSTFVRTIEAPALPFYALILKHNV